MFHGTVYAAPIHHVRRAFELKTLFRTTTSSDRSAMAVPIRVCMPLISLRMVLLAIYTVGAGLPCICKLQHFRLYFAER